MSEFLAARARAIAACWLLLLVGIPRVVAAQTWNDPRSRALVEAATRRRDEQLADTALRDYRATAHGYVAFLAQLGEGFRTPPKVVKADELEDEVYWRAPNLSKQRIVGRRDTLLLPTDIAYHTDHLGIVQNNFPDIIRIGNGGDEVADVPHPLSIAGLRAYDFALADSFAIGSGAQRIHVYEVKVRPKDDRLARVVGAVYLDASSGQVVRMNFSFTRGAFLDKALDELSLVLENRLVAGRFWLPSRQQIEIVRRGEWLDFPARGIIRGRWEIGDYEINQTLAPSLFVGPEIVSAPPAVLAQHHWEGAILDSLPPDVRAITEPDIARVQAEARALVRARALATAQHATISARAIGDIVRFDRAEGLALGAGASKQFAGGVSVTARGRYGIDDKAGKGALDVAWSRPNGASVHLLASRDFRDVGDIAERSTVVNTLAAQEFGSDDTDPYLTRSVGARIDLAPMLGFDARFGGAFEHQSAVGVKATPVVGAFEPTIRAQDANAARFVFDATRPRSPWVWGTEVSMRIEGRLRVADVPDISTQLTARQHAWRGAVNATIERPFGAHRLATAFSVAGVTMHGADDFVRRVPAQELVYLGGPVSAPGYDYHSLVGTRGATAHVEWRMPAPFPAFSLGRYGHVPAQGTFAPYVHAAAVDGLGAASNGVRPAFGAAYLLPFDILRVDVARGVGRGGRWTFSVDVSRDFWSIL
jgi:hypothetical protein